MQVRIGVSMRETDRPVSVSHCTDFPW